MKTEVNQPCEICGANDSRIYMELRFPECGYPGEFSLRECSGCKLLFNSPRLDGVHLKQLYDKNYYFFNRPRGVEFRRIVQTYRRSFSLLKSKLSNDDTVLEIGCAKGYLLSLIKQQGTNVFGVEISESASSFARTQFGIPVFTGTLENYCATPDCKKFTAVMAIDVLEHVPTPEEFMKALNQVVSPGGYALIDTPNADAFNIKTEGKYWPGFNPFHIILYNRENLKRLLNRHGFTVEKEFSYGNSKRNATTKAGIKKLFVSSLRRVGMLNLLRSVNSFRKNSVDKYGLEDAIRDVKSNTTFFDSPDSRGELASNISGDNLIVVAKKTT